MIGIYNKIIFDGVSNYIFIKEIKEDVIILYINGNKEFLSWSLIEDGLIDIKKDQKIMLQLPVTLLSVKSVDDSIKTETKNKIINDIYQTIQNEVESGKDIENYDSIIKKLNELYNEQN